MSYMTKIEGYPEADDCKPGMAFFAGTGPAGKTCGDCKHRGYSRQSQKGTWSDGLQQDVYRSYRVNKCAMFKKLSGHHGQDISKQYAACKYFEAKAERA